MRNGRGQAIDTPGDGFDHWVGRQLHKVYDDVLNEPVPAELRKVLERFAAAPATQRPPDKPPGEDDR